MGRTTFMRRVSVVRAKGPPWRVSVCANGPQELHDISFVTAFCQMKRSVANPVGIRV